MHQESWSRVKAGGSCGGDGALLLRVIAAAAARFPPAQAAALTRDLLKVLLLNLSSNRAFCTLSTSEVNTNHTQDVHAG
jgi:hypothetical protein